MFLFDSVETHRSFSQIVYKHLVCLSYLGFFVFSRELTYFSWKLIRMDVMVLKQKSSQQNKNTLKLGIHAQICTYSRIINCEESCSTESQSELDCHSSCSFYLDKVRDKYEIFLKQIDLPNSEIIVMLYTCMIFSIDKGTSEFDQM